MHLTNVAVQKTAPDYDPEKVCKENHVGDRIDTFASIWLNFLPCPTFCVGMQVADSAAPEVPDCKTRPRDSRDPVQGHGQHLYPQPSECEKGHHK